ncbi:MAG: hypothetical protein GEV28_39585 [Actinophytocola sp.]|uniref:response regulator transcription factor n=1 Tax=Actinophytocola sp. TaxID=1872138 RepID=UPI00132A86D9|nr:helix-turn-helix transcriptional regulator [Actinophytocola sp.]MPZ86152.1 hypothetical protein [Actinophytocola sp.]
MRRATGCGARRPPCAWWTRWTSWPGRAGPARAAAAVEELAAGLGDADAPKAQALRRQGQAVLARDEAVLAEVCAELGRLGFRYDEATALARLGGWRASAELLEQALRAFDELGAARDVARVCRVFRGLGLPLPYPWRGGRRSYGSQLSPREHEVAALAAAGKSNREIATRLFLSQRTVESHVARVLRKLGGRSRRDLEDLLGPRP